MIRRMKKGDLPSVKSLMQSIPNFWHKAWDDKILERALSASGDLGLVYEVTGRVVAFAFCYDLGFRAYLGEFAVAEDTRRRGIGKELLSHAEAILKERGCELVISDVWKSAEPFYRKLGWQPPHAVLLRKRLIGDSRPAETK